MNRRGFLRGMAGILAAGAAPAILPSGIIMPIRTLISPTLTQVLDFGGNRLLTIDMITKEALRILNGQLCVAWSVNRQFDATFAAPSDTIKIRLPSRP